MAAVAAKRTGTGTGTRTRTGTRRGGTGQNPAGSKHGVSGKKDPFPGNPPLARFRVKRFLRGAAEKAPPPRSRWLRRSLGGLQQRGEVAATMAARTELLLAQDPGFLEPDPGQDPCTITQGDIAEAVDITSAAKHFELRLEQFGPYKVDYSRDGRFLLLGGRGGHVAALDWERKKLKCEFNVLESISDLGFLHSHHLLAVAQRRWLHIYDHQGLELNVLKSFSGVLSLQFLPHHFLLATANSSGFLQYLDVAVGKEVAAICTRGGRLGVMAQNPNNALIHLGHSNGTVTLWSPKSPEPLGRLLCHRGGVRAIAIDPAGMYMVSGGLDHRLQLWDLRMLRALGGLLLPGGGPGGLHFSQRRLLGVTCGDVVQVFQGVGPSLPPRPFLQHRPPAPPLALRFCPFQDVLGVGHSRGVSSLLVPGSGEPNPDGLQPHPHFSLRQRQEWEVKALLEKIPAELITMDPSALGGVDTATLEQKREERIQRLGFDPHAKKKFKPRRKGKGRDPQRRKRQVTHQELRAEIRQSQEEKKKKTEGGAQRKKGGGPLPPVPPPKRGALDRFKK